MITLKQPWSGMLFIAVAYFLILFGLFLAYPKGLIAIHQYQMLSSRNMGVPPGVMYNKDQEKVLEEKLVKYIDLKREKFFAKFQ